MNGKAICLHSLSGEGRKHSMNDYISGENRRKRVDIPYVIGIAACLVLTLVVLLPFVTYYSDGYYYNYYDYYAFAVIPIGLRAFMGYSPYVTGAFLLLLGLPAILILVPFKKFATCIASATIAMACVAYTVYCLTCLRCLLHVGAVLYFAALGAIIVTCIIRIIIMKKR